MAAIIELKYFNTFWLKKIKSITDVTPGQVAQINQPNGWDAATKTMILASSWSVNLVNVGQETTVNYTEAGTNYTWTSYVVSLDNSNATTRIVLNDLPPVPFTNSSTTTVLLGKIINFDNIPQAYIATADVDTDWLLEESRIRGGYNNTSVDLGVKAYLVEEDPRQKHRFSSLIHSGIFNSRTNVNQTNQFSVGEDITRTIDPANGSIQKLYAEDTNLIIFQESKVSRSLIDKDAIYSAEGNASVTSRNLVIGQNVAYAGEYGISTDPESFAVNGYRKYFTDRNQNVVCRLSRDGITVISSYGMTDFFRDKLSTAKDNLIGGWDAHNKQYVLSMRQSDSSFSTESSYDTLAFDETAKGWVSLFSYRPNKIISLNNNYFTAYEGKLWKHYEKPPNNSSMVRFYGVTYSARVTFVFNGGPSMVKNFQTINYEGDSGWSMSQFETNTDKALPVSQAIFATTLDQMQNSLLINSFKLKEDKYYADITNNTSSQRGEVVFGGSSSGVKGFFATVTMYTQSGSQRKELFAVSTGFVQSS
tara:strand:- start:6098 stop:7696 length:1599 start_codon:yes stop_codon:yes gene_type:complete